MRSSRVTALALLALGCAVGTEPLRDAGPLLGNVDLGPRDRPGNGEVTDPREVDADGTGLDAGLPETGIDAALADLSPRDAVTVPDAVDVVDGGTMGGCTGECTPGQSRECGRCGTQVCTTGCTWGGCTGEGSCTPGENRSCGRCGRDTCTARCTWGGCTGEGACAPGQLRTQGCDPCSQQVCGNACQWGACQLRPGAACEYRGGRNSRSCSRCRCGLQWCLNACQWSTDCVSCCSTCGGCL